MALTTRINASITAAETAADDQGTGSFTHAISLSATIASGTGASQNDRVFSDKRSIGSSANEDLDLAGSLGGKLVGVGATVVFAEVIALMIKASSANTNSVIITRPADTGFPLFDDADASLTLPPGGAAFFYFPGATGKAVTASTGDILNIANSGSGSAVEYEIVIVGRSA